MKYLRDINESLEDEFRQDLKEILLEAEDIGYEVMVDEFRSSTDVYDYACIQSYDYSTATTDKFINFNDIKDCLLRIKDYVGDRYIRCQIYINNSKGGRSWCDFNLTEDSNPIYDDIISISIDYKKPENICMKVLHTGMRNLKKFNEEITNDDITNLINWELIDDAKEMALEYLDMGYELYITVTYSSANIYHLNYSHTRNHDSTQILGPFYLDKIKSSKDLSYSIQIDINFSYGTHIIAEKETEEIKERIKSIYPDENIVRINKTFESMD